MDKKEYEEIEKNANILQHNASINCNADIQKAQNYYNGYQQGVEDLLKYIRQRRY
ncbi:MAG: hypothetical protein Q3Y15_00085 [Candidatus Copromonas sp.]|jgi:TATA-binding protein-associated factor Taf7|uniref:Uncharacterized protein n=1 Tax=Siphoviridae sp. ct1TR2 TaxID=2825309 RepID=A0A8S5NU92_9CAUD|nr:hypothetical protein [Clostridium fessum]MDR3779340.1 hypothetical protein [Candidatus Copromonas sp.]DAD97659.1 MAG TPA: hypothetical protein [Siphoviridae sp. ct1TR2]DAZ40701.1 MAG TPA: hypothetical protein [Caudoviricetes sp.]